MYKRKKIVSQFNRFDKEYCDKYDEKCSGCPLKKEDGKTCYYTELKQGVLKEV